MFAMLFPGQGSQAIGMLAGLAQERPEVADTFSEASEALGLDLWRLCQEGPESELNRTENTQPAMLAAVPLLVTIVVQVSIELREAVAGQFIVPIVKAGAGPL